MIPRPGSALFGCCLLMAPAMGQYAIGTRGGVLAMEMLSARATKAVQPLTTGSIGLFLQVPLGERSGYRLSVDHVVRRCDLRQYDERSRMEELAMRTTFVQLTSEARFRLGDRSPFHFEFGPQLGFQLAERSKGTSFYTYPVYGADPRGVDESRAPMRFTDVRLRIGVGADMPLGRHWLAVLSAGAGMGSGNWFRGASYLNAEFLGQAGVAYAPSPLVRKRKA